MALVHRYASKKADLGSTVVHRRPYQPFLNSRVTVMLLVIPFLIIYLHFFRDFQSSLHDWDSVDSVAPNDGSKSLLRSNKMKPRRNMDMVTHTSSLQNKFSSSLPYEDSEHVSLPLPTPIVVVGLPKTGTSTVHAFFRKSGYNSSHWRCHELKCGLCMKAAVERGNPPLKACGQGSIQVFAQMDFEQIGQCAIPQISYLPELYADSPKATWILTKRNLTRWAKSLRHWVGAGEIPMSRRLAKCSGRKRKNATNVGPASTKPQDLIQWHLLHWQRVRDFCERHTSLKLLEIDIEDPDTADIMAYWFQSNRNHWGHENDSIQSAASRQTNSTLD